MFGRKIQTDIPTHTRSDTNKDNVYANLKRRQDTQKRYHDRSAKDLNPLYPGQEVMLQDSGKCTWVPAKVVSECDEPRSYMIRTPNGNVLRRNRQQIRECGKPRMHPKRVTFADGERNRPAESNKPMHTGEHQSSACSRDASEYRTSSGRMVKKPNRYGYD